MDTVLARQIAVRVSTPAELSLHWLEILTQQGHQRHQVGRLAAPLSYLDRQLFSADVAWATPYTGDLTGKACSKALTSFG